VVTRFGDATEPAVREQVAIALEMKTEIKSSRRRVRIWRRKGSS
jgi:hypothetical protein